jgi:hypothetical protein
VPPYAGGGTGTQGGAMIATRTAQPAARAKLSAGRRSRFQFTPHLSCRGGSAHRAPLENQPQRPIVKPALRLGDAWVPVRLNTRMSRCGGWAHRSTHRQRPRSGRASQGLAAAARQFGFSSGRNHLLRGRAFRCRLLFAVTPKNGAGGRDLPSHAGIFSADGKAPTGTAAAGIAGLTGSFSPTEGSPRRGGESAAKKDRW